VRRCELASSPPPRPRLRRLTSAGFPSDTPLEILPSGHHVSRVCDFIMYSVEAAHIDKVVAQFGPCPSNASRCCLGAGSVAQLPSLTYPPAATLDPTATKVGAVVAGQTSVKAPEKQAFEAHLPEDCHIVSLHSLHGPTVSPEGQPLVRPQPGAGTPAARKG
jgi:prephenate dehydrogenase (NADP+)